MSGTRDGWGGRRIPQTRAALIARDTTPTGTLTCPLCGHPITATDRIEIDHAIGRAFGGGHQLSNLRLTHAQCNQDRGHDQQRALAAAKRSRSRAVTQRTRWQRLADHVTATTSSDPGHGAGGVL